MPLPIATDLSQSPHIQATYPAITKQSAGIIDGVLTDVTSTTFSDKIMVTVTQYGRLAQWIHVPLDSPNPSFAEQYIPSSDEDGSLLPIAHLTPKTLLGGSTSERETISHLYATQIASAILTRNPEEKRIVVVGLGLSNTEVKRDVFYDVMDLIHQVL
ncbi:hypothetical protein JMJ35_004820 [Cladonia borealis]|uniref:Proteasome assembly chaperone 3 n=1 Tax=Cladonia borealis TaxID=184061 RepID=A0AA39V1X3_9LECA|nr:hypothetical protein JMJ35_004820 [Cladonia borealis]